jgi:hypothetical protein
MIDDKDCYFEQILYAVRTICRGSEVFTLVERLRIENKMMDLQGRTKYAYSEQGQAAKYRRNAGSELANTRIQNPARADAS